MSDPNYKRTSGYKNYMNKRGYRPIVKSGFARLATGRVYKVLPSGQLIGAPKPTPRTKAQYKAAAIAGQLKNQKKRVAA